MSIKARCKGVDNQMCGTFRPEFLNIDHQVEKVRIENIVMEVLPNKVLPAGVRLQHEVTGLLETQMPALHDLLDPVLLWGDDTNA